MIAAHRQSITSTLRTITLLAAMTSLLLTMVTPFVGPAYGAEGDDNTVYGFFTFSDGVTLETVNWSEDPIDTGGPNIELVDYGWRGEDGTENPGTSADPNDFHVSCSETLYGTLAKVLTGNTPFTNGIDVEIVDFYIIWNNGSDTKECTPSTFVDLEVAKTATTAQVENAVVADVSPGDTFTYTVTVSNPASGEGSADALNVVLEDTVPAPFVVTGVSSPTATCGFELNDDDVRYDVTCTQAVLADEGGSFTVTISVSVPTSAPCGPTENIAYASADNTTPDQSGPVDVEIVDCNGAAEIVKYDTDQRVLEGASYELYLDDGDNEFDPVADGGGDSLEGSCTTDGDGDCSVSDLVPGWYWVYETEDGAPDGYGPPPSNENPQLKEVTAGTTTTFNFTNPRLPYSIDVTPETAVNPSTLDHDFLVTATEDGDPVAAGTELQIDWDWDVAPDPEKPGIIKVNGTDVTPTDSTTCTTQDNVAWDEGTVDGACIITVTSYGSAASGTLTATFDLPYQHGTGTDGPTEGGPTVATGETALDTIFDEGDKEWRGFRVDIEEPATNLAGDPHPFTVTVWEVLPGGGEQLAGDVVVGATWTNGPTDSTIAGDGTSAPTGTDAACTTATSGEDQGTCVLTVDSDNPGEGDLTITVLEGMIGTHAVTQTTFTDNDNVDTSKTWVAYRLWVTPDTDINQVDWNHPFVVHVQSNDGGDWENVDGATFEAPSTLTASDGDWSFDSDLAGNLTLVDDTCDDGTVAGECTITVISGTTGTVKLTVGGVTVPWNGGTEHLELSDTALSAGNGTHDNVGEKTWVDYGVTIGTDGTNRLGDEHPFTVSVTRSDVGDLAGATVDLTWDGPTGSTIYPTDQPGSAYTDLDAGTAGVQFQCTTDDDGDCDFEVNSTTTEGLGTLSVTKVTDESGEVSAGGSISFDVGEKSTTKEWISFDVDLDDPAINLTGDDHPFTVTAAVTDAEGTGDAAGTVTLEWDGPIGSSVSNGTDTETVGAGGDPVQITCTLVSGECTITVDSDDPGAGDLTALSITSGAFTVDLTEADSGQSASLSIPVETTKTWIGVDLDISPDSTNRVVVDHTFDVDATLFDGDPVDGEVLPVTGATLCVSLDSTVGSIVGGTAGDGDPCAAGEVEITSTTDGEFDVTVESSDGGTADVTLESIHFSYEGTSYSVDLVPGTDGYLPQDGSDLEATKTWIDYALAISPQNATNLLHTDPDLSDPDHAMVVTLSSEGGASVDGQTIELTLTSDNGAWIEAVDTDGDGDVETLPADTTSTDCVTTGAGLCNVVISADTPGTATLSASFDFSTDDDDYTITSKEFGLREDPDNGQDADKTWTTYSVTVEADAVNLLGTPHTFKVTVMQDGDDPVPDAVFADGDEEAESFISISDPKDAASITGGTCFTTGTDDGGECTVSVTSTETTLATVTANYLGEAASSDSAFFTDGGSKQWIDYRLDVDPNTADNLVDTNHVFFVEVEMDLGEDVETEEEQWQPVPDGSEVTLTLTGNGAITDVGTGGTIDLGGLTGTCLTVDGLCEVTITSPDAGQSSLTAEFVGTAAGELENEDDTESATFTDDPAVKNWVDYLLVMSPDALNPIGTTHTFTATLTTDTGAGFGAAGGEEVDFSIEGVGEVVEVENGTVDEDGLGGTCTTDTDGTCDIVIASDEVGTTTVTGTYGAVVGETSRDYPDSAVKTWESNPAIDLVKDVDVIEAAIGDIVTYTYTITNTGDVTLTNVRLVDLVEVNGIFRDLLELLGFETTITLEPGESTSLTAVHLVTEDDLPGPIDNVATVTGEAPDGEKVSDTDDETVDPFGDPSILLDKVVAIPGADPDAPTVGVDPDQPGDTVIPYEFTVTNTGNVTLTDVTLTDIVLTEIPDGGPPTYGQAEQVDGVVIDITLADTTLSPNESTTGTLAYQVRAVDVTNSIVVNVAEVTGVGPTGTTVSDEDPAFVTIDEVGVLPGVITRPPAPAPQPAPAPAVLAVTGLDTMRLALFAAMIAGLGVMLLLGMDELPRARRRRAKG